MLPVDDPAEASDGADTDERADAPAADGEADSADAVAEAELVQEVEGSTQHEVEDRDPVLDEAAVTVESPATDDVRNPDDAPDDALDVAEDRPSTPDGPAA